jgi:hypothetical protein
MSNCLFPSRPFDSQVFVDVTRVRWVFNSEDKSWQRSGVETDIPLATETQPGLLSAQLKQLLDGIPPKGGHFGIIARPLLSVVPLAHETIVKDTVEFAIKTEAGSSIRAVSAHEAAFEENAFAGKLLRFNTGVLKDSVFLIGGNTDVDIKLIGDSGSANSDDKFEIIEPTALNLNGIIAGDIQLVSESIDIACVDHVDNPIITDVCPPCNDNTEKPPALDFKVSDLFKSQFCAQQPGCDGPRGDKGKKGKNGDDGTGDGPQGDVGSAGVSAPSTPMQFDGIKIIDIDDIYDTAVVAIEVDAPNGRLNIVKAKIKTPDDNTPASQVIASEVFRTLEFTGNGFEYNLLRPTVDPIGTDDVKIGYYPQGFETKTDGATNKPDTTTVSIANLSDFIKEVEDYWEVKLKEISAVYDQQIKDFITAKDADARKALATLCQELAECEWERPIEFCLGPTPNECNPLDPAAAASDPALGNFAQSGGASNFQSQTDTGLTGLGISGPSGNKIIQPIPPDPAQQAAPHIDPNTGLSTGGGS